MQKVFEWIIAHITKRLNRINQNTASANAKLALRIAYETLAIGIAYSIYSSFLFGGTWYLDIIKAMSVVVFMYCYIDIRLELIRNKIKNDVPKTIRKIRYYLIHTGNIDRALEKTYKRAPLTTKPFIGKLIDALKKDDVPKALSKLKAECTEDWFKILCGPIEYCKLYGDTQTEEGKLISNSIDRITRLVETINLQKGLDDVEMLGFQVAIFILPLLGVPILQAFNKELLLAMEQPDLYASLVAQNKVAIMFILSNIFTLLCSWVRKNS